MASCVCGGVVALALLLLVLDGGLLVGTVDGDPGDGVGIAARDFSCSEPVTFFTNAKINPTVLEA